LGDGTLDWVDSPAGTLMFRRDPSFTCLVNLDGDPVALPEGWDLALASDELDADGRLAANTAIWLTR
jgi:alpha-glucosidase